MIKAKLFNTVTAGYLSSHTYIHSQAVKWRSYIRPGRRGHEWDRMHTHNEDFGFKAWALVEQHVQVRDLQVNR